MKPKILFLVEDDFEDLEMFYPYYRLIEEGYEVTVASTSLDEKKGKHGYMIKPDKEFSKINPADFDAVVIPGGKSPERVRLSKDAVSIVRHFIENNKPVAAICHGPQLLISAQGLGGRKVTCWKGIRDDVIVAGADYVDREVIVDRNLVTSRMPDDLPAFCRELIKKLKSNQE
ncbi:MAG TPA: type 1 glutamine amidotransferase [Archaeoglobaceae archaeon]|nr:type 1 glutamine amidotransferase [Archaeoglobaceae archaeon]